MNTKSFLRTSLVAATLAASASAQLVTWGPVIPTISPADVSLNGTLVVARNLHAATASVNPTVNGVMFTGSLGPAGWGGAITNDGLNGSTTGDSDYDNLLRQARATSGPAGSPTGWGAIRLDTLASLSIGTTYEIQCWYTDQRTGSATNVLYDRQMTLSSVVGNATLSQGEVTNLPALIQGPNSGLLDADPDNAPAVSTPDVLFGSYCTGVFTRTSNDPMYLLVQGSHPLGNNLKPHLTAFQIREVTGPTWSSYGAGCAGAAGVSALQLVSPPALGGTFALDVANAGTGIVFMVTGVTQLNIPVPFAPFAVNCTALASTELADFVPTVAGTGSWSLTIPNQPSLVGVQLFNQAIELDAVWSLSDGGVGTIQ